MTGFAFLLVKAALILLLLAHRHPGIKITEESLRSSEPGVWQGSSNGKERLPDEHNIFAAAFYSCAFLMKLKIADTLSPLTASSGRPGALVLHALNTSYANYISGCFIPDSSCKESLLASH